MIDIKSFNQSRRKQASARGFATHLLGSIDSHQMLGLSRAGAGSAPRIYLSSGVHGDEPAGPLALLDLLRDDLFPADLDIAICPLVNPNGIESGRRENRNGVDLNRDFRKRSAQETRTLARFIDAYPRIDLSICLHEDWESSGFYLYAIGCPESYPRKVLADTAQSGPIESAECVDGYQADKGLIRPPADEAVDSRDDWPEALYLYSKSKHAHLTTESPSALSIQQRVAMQKAAVQSALKNLHQLAKHFDSSESDTRLLRHKDRAGRRDTRP